MSLSSNGRSRADRIDFDRTFDIEVKPRLLAVINVAAHLVRLDVYSFGEASSFVMQIATRLGATRLQHNGLYRLAEWVDLRLVRHIDLPPHASMLTAAQLSTIREDFEKLR